MNYFALLFGILFGLLSAAAARIQTPTQENTHRALGDEAGGFCGWDCENGTYRIVWRLRSILY